jgi:hypothetical protein
MVPGVCDSAPPPTVELGPGRLTRCVLPELAASVGKPELKEA